MKINISSVLKNEGSDLPFASTVDVGTISYLGNSFCFASPIQVKGVLRNIGGTMELKGTLRGEYDSFCDCCGAKVHGLLETDFDERFNDDLSGCDEECFSLNSTTLDISGLINSLIWENLPMKLLCREDCKGLCSICGCNLNETVCNCETTVYDPRLAILREEAKKGKE